MSQMRDGDLVTRGASAPRARADRALARAPTEHEQARVRIGVDRQGGDSPAIPATLAARSSVMREWLAPS